MDKARHTPGPWCVSNDNADRAIVQSGAQRIATCAASHEGDANARLIAAAPALLEALIVVVDCLESGQAISAGDTARAAIAQARGEG